MNRTHKNFLQRTTCLLSHVSNGDIRLLPNEGRTQFSTSAAPEEAGFLNGPSIQ
jgi:hypothetical protein